MKKLIFIVAMLAVASISVAQPYAAQLLSPSNPALTFLTPTLSWQANSDGDAPTYYRVYLDTNANPTTLVDSTEALAGVNTFAITEPLLPETTYYWKVIAGDETGDSPNTPAIWKFTTLADETGELVEFIAGTTAINAPIHPWYMNSYVQTIYPASDLGLSAPTAISMIAFQWNGINAAPNSKQWEVFMGTTSRANFPVENPSNFVPFTDLVSVFDGNVVIEATQMWVQVHLTTPFIYPGSGNLVIAVWEKNFASNDDGNNAKFIGSTSGNRSLVNFGSTGLQINPYTGAHGGTYNVSRTGNPNITLTHELLPPYPIAVVSPLSKDFGVVESGSDVSHEFTIRNVGGVTLEVSAIEFTADTTEFSFVSGTSTDNIYIAPGSTHRLTIKYAPINTGEHNATVKITTNDQDNDEIFIDLSGECPYIPVDLRVYVYGSNAPDEGLLNVSVSLNNTAVGLTDSQGMLLITNLIPDDTINLSFELAGYRSVALEGFVVNTDSISVLMMKEYSVFGTVVDSRSGDLLQGVMVRLVGGDYSGSAFTDATGAFTLDDVITGQYNLSFTLAEYTDIDSVIAITEADFDMGEIAMQGPQPLAQLLSPANASITLRTLTLSWQAHPDSAPISYYKVYFDTNPNPTTLVDSTLAIAGINTYAVVDTLLPQTTYYWKVIAGDIYGDTYEQPTIWHFTTISEDVEEEEPPLAAQLLSPSDGSINFRTLTFSWQAHPDSETIAYYKVYLDTNPNPTTLVDSTTVIDNINTYTVTEPLLPGATYYWKVIPGNGLGDSTEPPTIRRFTTVQDETGDMFAIMAGSQDIEAPIFPLRRQSYVQTIYPATDLGFTEPTAITTIAFQWNGGSDAPNSRQWEVFMSTTNRSSFTAPNRATLIPFEDFISVFDGNVVIEATQMWVQVHLTTPFIYSGSGNLVIAVWEKDHGTEGDSNDGKFIGTSSGYRSLGCYSNFNTLNPYTGTYPGDNNFWRTGIPNITIVHQDPPPYPVTIVSPLSNDFGVVPYMEEALQVFTIRNNGGDTLQVDIAFTAPSTEFSFANGDMTESVNIAPGTLYSFTIRYLPTSVGEHIATIDITTNDPANPQILINLSGECLYIPVDLKIYIHGSDAPDDGLRDVAVFVNNTTVGTTDSLGILLITDLALDDTIYLAFEKAGYRTVAIENFVVDVDSITVLMNKEYSVLGTVVDSHNGDLLEGVTVTLSSVDYANNLITDATGNFAFDDVISGQYSLHIILAGYTSVDSVIIVAEADIDMGEIELALAPDTELRIFVYGSDNVDEGLRDVTVFKNDIAVGVTDSLGILVIPDLMTNATIDLAFELAGYRSVALEGFVVNTDSISVLMMKEYSAFGTVVDSRSGDLLEGVLVKINGVEYADSLYTDATGVFAFDDVITGDYTVSFALTGYTSVERVIVIAETDYDMGEIAMTDPNVGDSDIYELSVVTGLKGNYPNPFNPSTTISFAVGGADLRSQTSDLRKVTIDIYNIKGQKVRSLLSGEYSTGHHSIVWNGTDDSGRSVGSGIYFYRMKTDSFVQTKKMILMK